MKIFKYIGAIWKQIEWRELRIHREQCPLCRFSYLVKLGENEHSIRCLRCGANPVVMSLANILLRYVPAIGTCDVYELSSRGPFFRFLQKSAGTLAFSEYFDDVLPGAIKNGVPCEDVQNLSHPEHSFDVCTSTDVFEHVPDDTRGFAEIHRVLRPGGFAVFTVPLSLTGKTIERAKIVEGAIEHVLPPEYHDDHIRGHKKVLCFRNYGPDIVDRLEEQGFKEARIVSPDLSAWWGYGRHVVLAFR